MLPVGERPRKRGHRKKQRAIRKILKKLEAQCRTLLYLQQHLIDSRFDEIDLEVIPMHFKDNAPVG